ncbi:MAG: sigma factor-like helix-turn-helix DNA-binding protein [Actinomycetota bacterium]
MRSRRSTLYSLVIESQTHNATDPSVFLAEAGPRLERALVARFGIDDGVDAAAEAMAYAMTHWDRVHTMANPAGYLYRVGESHGRRLASRWSRLDALVSEPTTDDAVLDLDLQRALLDLRASERVAIVLVHAHGYSYRHAAEVLDLPITTITNHIHRGMARLRRLLEH